MAIKRAAELDFSHKKFMVIISGQPGLGKTTLALSAPKPFLFDTDNGIARIRAEHRQNVLTSITEKYDELLRDMDTDEYRAAESVVIDTGGTLVQLMKDWAKEQDKKAAKDGRAMYGVIKTEIDRLSYTIRNRDKKHLVVVFHTTEQTKGDTIQTRISCEGSTKDIIWTPADFGGHMFMMGNKRMIGFTPTEEYFAKGCFGVSGVIEVPELKTGQPNNFLTNLFKLAQENINREAQIFGAERAEYDAAMETGRAAIGNITDPESAQAATAILSGINHALTSKAELQAALKLKLKECGLRYDKEGGRYVSLADAKPAQ